MSVKVDFFVYFFIARIIEGKEEHSYIIQQRSLKFRFD